jgi:predicted ATPase
MFSVEFSNYRAFASTGIAHIRPITFLVGENSTGKTSFLAGLRTLLEIFRDLPPNPFNRDPFFLGGFEEIAYFRGGRAGRAKTFTLTAHLPLPRANTQADPRQRALSFANEQEVSIDRRFTATFHFAKGPEHTNLERLSFRHPLLSGSVYVEANNLCFNLTHDGKEIGPIKAEGFSINTLRGFPLFLILETVISRQLSLFERKSVDLVETQTGGNDRPSAEIYRVTPELRRLVSEVSRSLNAFQYRVFASAPVRTEPKRTYTPSELTPSAHGAHVPLELAALIRRSPEAWSTVRKGLIAFGQKAGLFDDIEIRKLGRGDNDPFQIQVKVSGPRRNLMDVGYGVSQALPLIYTLQNARRYDVLLLQQPEVHLHPKAQAEIGSLLAQTLRDARNEKIMIVETHSDYLVDRVRIEIGEGNIRPGDVGVLFFERSGGEVTIHNMSFDSNGKYNKVPDGFREFFRREHAALLRL